MYVQIVSEILFLWQQLQNISLGGEEMRLWMPNNCNKISWHANNTFCEVM